MQIVRGAPNCAKKCETRLVVRIYAGNGLKCEYVWETAKSAIPHPPHLNVASVCDYGIFPISADLKLPSFAILVGQFR